MLALWMLYAIVVGTAVAGAAALLEERSALSGKGRWVWGVALVAALVIPLSRPGLVPRPAPAIDIGSAVLVPLAGIQVGAGASHGFDLGAFLARWNGPLAGAWAGATLVLLTLLLGGVLRLRRQRGEWRRGELDGTPVLISEGLGPAVVGLIRPEIVVPEWVLELGPTERALVLEHEEEHRRRRDPALLALGAVAPVVMPWNPALWWSLSRLRHAVEADCDHRVLASGLGTPTRYARLLLDVGSRALGIVPVGAGFGERSSSLERRVRALLRSRVVGGVRGVLLRGAVATALVFVACLVDSPTAPTSFTPTAEQTMDLANAPVFTPYTVSPSILNKAEVVAAMEKAYPPLLRDAGIGGTAVVYFFIDGDGRVKETRIFKSSGHKELDAAALSVARLYRFSPALNRDKKVPVWVTFPITFQVAGGTVERQEPPPAPRTTHPIEAAPTFTPYTVGPRVLNKAEVVAAMEKAYPPLLRDAGVSGTAVIYFFIDADGNLRATRLLKSSGHRELDAAALSVAKTYRFSPAENRGQKVPVWVTFGITFGASAPATRADQPSQATGKVTVPPTVRLPPAPPSTDQTAVSGGPNFIAYTDPPTILNRSEVVDAMDRAYPPLLRNAGVGGTADVSFFVGTDGRVKGVRLLKSSGHNELDLAALSLASTYRFKPAMNKDVPVAVWTRLPISFGVR